MTTAYERVISALVEFTGYQPPRDGAEWKCPAHGDNKPSLSVTPKGDKVLVHCQAGCDLDAVLSALNLTRADLFDTNGNGKHDDHGGEWTPRGPATAIYTYTDENGYTLFEVLRTEDKEFPLRVPDPTAKHGWRWRLGDARRVIYRLPKVIEAVEQGWPVWIAEGEKDVHALENAGEVATCNPGGAEKWRPEYAQWFEGAMVYVVADKDAAGRRHAAKVVESLEGRAAKVTVVEAAEGKDAYDHLVKQGRSTKEFIVIRGDTVFPDEQAAPDAPAEEVETSLPALARPFIPVSLDLSTRPEPRPTMGDFNYKAGLTVLQSEPGVGKTWVALWIAVQVLRQGGSVLYFDEEGGEDLARERLYALGATNDLIDGRLFYFPFEARKWDADDLIALEAVAEAAPKPAIAVFDSLPDFLSAAGKSEDSAQDVTAFINEVLGILRRAEITQLVLDHMRKPEQGKSKAERSRYARGSGSKLAKADATVLLEVAEPFDATTSGKLRYWKTKDRYGRLPLPRLEEPGALLAVNVGDGRVAIEPLQVTPSSKWDGPTECMERIKELLGNPDVSELSQSVIRLTLPFRPETIAEGLRYLTAQGDLIVRTGPKNSLIYRLAHKPGTLDMGDS